MGGRGIRRQGRGRRKRRVRWKRMGVAERCWWNRWKRREGRRQESRQRGLVIVTHDIFTV